MKSKYLTTKTYPCWITEPLKGKDVFSSMSMTCDILDKLDVNWQLGSKTLLGFIREDQGFIDDHTSIDIDILDFTVSYDEIYQAFTSKGFLCCRRQYFKEKEMQIAFTHPDSKIIIDLCFFYDWVENIKINISCDGIFARPEWSLNSKIVYPKHSYFKRGYNIPAETDRYLISRYEDGEKLLFSL